MLSLWKCRDCRSCGKAMDNAVRYPQLSHNRLDNSEDGVTHNHLNNSVGVIHSSTMIATAMSI